MILYFFAFDNSAVDHILHSNSTAARSKVLIEGKRVKVNWNLIVFIETNMNISRSKKISVGEHFKTGGNWWDKAGLRVKSLQSAFEFQCQMIKREKCLQTIHIVNMMMMMVMIP